MTPENPKLASQHASPLEYGLLTDYFSGLGESFSSDCCESASVFSSVCVWSGSVTSFWFGLRRYSSSSALMATFSGISHLLKCSRALKWEGKVGMEIIYLYEQGYATCGLTFSHHLQSCVGELVHLKCLQSMNGTMNGSPHGSRGCTNVNKSVEYICKH